jgi:hypothetical protein
VELRLTAKDMNRNTIILLAMALTALAVTAPVTAAVSNTALLLQKSPAEGGQVTLGEGVHQFQRGSDVTLTAVANPGYQFVYWIGDVTDCTANTTAVMLDSPKIIIAVFERATYDFYQFAERAQSSRGGGSGLFTSAIDYSNQQINPIARKRESFHWPSLPDDDETETEFPVPDDSLQPGEIPVPNEVEQPVPEPATILLFGSGVMIVKILGTRKRNTSY